MSSSEVFTASHHIAAAGILAWVGPKSLTVVPSPKTVGRGIGE